jgi:diguanylate cyclase (GGDEF)-like protein
MSDGSRKKPAFNETRVVQAKAPDSNRDRPILTVVAGTDVGRVFSLYRRDQTSVGRVDTCDLTFDDDSLSREHGRFTRLGGSLIFQDLESRNGSFVNEERVKNVRVLEDGDRIALGAGTTVLRYTLVTADEEHKLREVFESTQKDGLTGLFNRRTLEGLLDREIARAVGSGGDLVVVMIDLDHFKKVNDGYGHPAGDAVLREAAQRLMACVRPGDVAARYGGEEMTVLLRDVNATAGAAIAEQIRRSIAGTPIAIGGGKALVVTASCGLAALSECATPDKPSLFGKADARLYAAKQGGRNRVVATG